MRIVCHINRRLSKEDASYREKMEQCLNSTSIFNMDTIDAIMHFKDFAYVMTYADNTALYMPSINTPKHRHDIDVSFQRDWSKRYLVRAGYRMFITIPGPVCSTYSCFVRTPKQLMRALETWESDCCKEWERLHHPEVAKAAK